MGERQRPHGPFTTLKRTYTVQFVQIPKRHQSIRSTDGKTWRRRIEINAITTIHVTINPFHTMHVRPLENIHLVGKEKIPPTARKNKTTIVNTIDDVKTPQETEKTEKQRNSDDHDRRLLIETENLSLETMVESGIDSIRS